MADGWLLTESAFRAKKFRERATKASYDLDYFFKLADQNPTYYIRK